MHRYKTQLCVHFESRGACSYGNQCAFAHGKSELQQKTRAPREKNNTYSKSPGLQQKMGRHNGLKDAGGKGSKGGKGGKGVAGSSSSGSLSRNQHDYGSNIGSGNVKSWTNTYDSGAANGATPRHLKENAPHQAAAFAAPEEPVGRLGAGWDDYGSDLGGGWDAATLMDELATAPAPQEAHALPREVNVYEGRSFFDLKSARGMQSTYGERNAMARENNAPFVPKKYINGLNDNWFSKAPHHASAAHRSEERTMPVRTEPPLMPPPPSMSFTSAFEQRYEHGNGQSAEAKGALSSDFVSPVDEVGSMFSPMGLRGQFALGQDTGDVDVEAFALGTFEGNPGIGGFNQCFKDGRY